MLAAELDYHLPPELIAQSPAHPRDAARLLRVDRASGQLSHHLVRDLPGLLRPSDLLVLNDTRVLRARLCGRRASGGAVEALLLKERGYNAWECLLKPSARLHSGEIVSFERDGVTAQGRLDTRLEDGWLMSFSLPDGSDLRAALPMLGAVPLPPYIRQLAPEASYQTVYARAAAAGAAPLDSAAAPTAGLHFTSQLLQELQARGASLAFVTLAVGPGTFRPVKTEQLEDHVMHVEEYEVPAATSEAIARQKSRGHRVVAVGTTSARVLESAAQHDGSVAAGASSTGIFITPGYCFKAVDALLTNFHLPRSTLLALVSAFAQNGPQSASIASNGENRSLYGGLALIQRAYAAAVAERYRFFSFGDAMLIE